MHWNTKKLLQEWHNIVVVTLLLKLYVNLFLLMAVTHSHDHALIFFCERKYSHFRTCGIISVATRYATRNWRGLRLCLSS